MNEKASPDWLAIEQEYAETTQTIVQICKKHDISRSALAQARARFGWPGRYAKRAVKRGSLIGRLFAVLEKQIEKLENEIMGETSSDKEVALLGNLSRTLEKLVELDEKQSSPKTRGDKPSKAMIELREKLATRISQLEKN